MSKKRRYEKHSERQSMKRSVEKYLKTQQLDITRTTGVCKIAECRYNNGNVCNNQDSRCLYKDER